MNNCEPTTNEPCSPVRLESFSIDELYNVPLRIKSTGEIAMLSKFCIKFPKIFKDGTSVKQHISLIDKRSSEVSDSNYSDENMFSNVSSDDLFEEEESIEEAIEFDNHPMNQTDDSDYFPDSGSADDRITLKVKGSRKRYHTRSTTKPKVKKRRNVKRKRTNQSTSGRRCLRRRCKEPISYANEEELEASTPCENKKSLRLRLRLNRKNQQKKKPRRFILSSSSEPENDSTRIDELLFSSDSIETKAPSVKEIEDSGKIKNTVRERVSPEHEGHVQQATPDPPSVAQTRPDSPSGAETIPDPPSGVEEARPDPPSSAEARPDPPSGAEARPDPPSGAEARPDPPPGAEARPDPPSGAEATPDTTSSQQASIESLDVSSRNELNANPVQSLSPITVSSTTEPPQVFSFVNDNSDGSKEISYFMVRDNVLEFRCIICDELCETWELLTLHTNQKHRENSNTIKCGFVSCDYSASSIGQIEAHRIIHHRNESVNVRKLTKVIYDQILSTRQNNNVESTTGEDSLNSKSLIDASNEASQHQCQEMSVSSTFENLTPEESVSKSPLHNSEEADIELVSTNPQTVMTNVTPSTASPQQASYVLRIPENSVKSKPKKQQLENARIWKCCPICKILIPQMQMDEHGSRLHARQDLAPFLYECSNCTSKAMFNSYTTFLDHREITHGEKLTAFESQRELFSSKDYYHVGQIIPKSTLQSTVVAPTCHTVTNSNSTQNSQKDQILLLVAGLYRLSLDELKWTPSVNENDRVKLNVARSVEALLQHWGFDAAIVSNERFKARLKATIKETLIKSKWGATIPVNPPGMLQTRIQQPPESTRNVQSRNSTEEQTPVQNNVPNGNDQNRPNRGNPDRGFGGNRNRQLMPPNVIYPPATEQDLFASAICALCQSEFTLEEINFHLTSIHGIPPNEIMSGDPFST